MIPRLIDFLSRFPPQVAEDNPIAQKLLDKQLLRLGFSVDCTNNGLEAVKVWSTNPPGYYDLAFIDYHMPKCDGVEATRRIRKLEDELDAPVKMPIVALSGELLFLCAALVAFYCAKTSNPNPFKSFPADIQISARNSCLNAGMNGYLTKPLKMADLIVVLRRHILQRR